MSGGATREDAQTYWFAEIRHYVYAGDTGLHVAAAAYRPAAAKSLIATGADVGARNRRGAEPLHYAADGNATDPTAQRKVIEQLIAAGADPNRRDKSGVASPALRGSHSFPPRPWVLCSTTAPI